MDGILSVLGFGNMGQALVRGVLDAELFAPSQIRVYDIDSTKQETAVGWKLTVVPSMEELGEQADYLLLAVKPQNMDEALRTLRPAIRPQTLVISIAAGISIKYIQDRLGTDIRVVRVMPNIAATVKEGAAGIALSANCLPPDSRIARNFFDAVGTAVMTSEESLHAVTALSGSGPAYFFYMVECLIQAAVKEGLSQKQAETLAVQTIVGSAKLLQESGESPGTLREKVTSKGGTTAAALGVFFEKGLEDIIYRAFRKAMKRSQELGN